MRGGKNWAAWALFAAALLQCFLGFVGWAMNSLSFGRLDWVFSFSGGFYLGLAFAAHWMPVPTTLVGAGLYACFLGLQAQHSVAALQSGLVFKIPVALLLLFAVAAALWRRFVAGKHSVDAPAS